MAKPFVTPAAIVVTENYIVMLIYDEHSGGPGPLCWLLSSTKCKCVCNAHPRPSILSSGCRFCLIIIYAVVFREGMILDVASIIRQRVRAQFSVRISIAAACYFCDARTPAAHSLASTSRQKYFSTLKIENLSADDAFFLSENWDCCRSDLWFVQ